MKNQAISVHYIACIFLGSLLFFSHAVVAKEELKHLADEAAKAHGLDPYLFRALVYQESKWKPHVVSPVITSYSIHYTKLYDVKLDVQ